MSEVFVEVWRGEHIESIHRGDVVVTDAKGQIIHFAGNSEKETYWRSAAKPFQVLPLLAQGGKEKFGFTLEEIALMAASHSGSEHHTRLVKAVLNKIGLSEQDLQCGIASPLDPKVAEALLKSGKSYSVMHNNCSGKHAAMLALAILLEILPNSYYQKDHQVQQCIAQVIAESTGLALNEIDTGVDGCGVPVFWLPLKAMARAYARLAQPDKGEWGNWQTPVQTVLKAMTSYPEVVAGKGRFDTILMEVTHGRLVAKFGAEAVFCIGHTTKGQGLALKIEDGSVRALAPAVLGLLERYGWITAKEGEVLRSQCSLIVKNHRQEAIGKMKFALPR